MKNLHRIVGSQFQHAKPGLCERCKHCKPYHDGFTEWEGYCEARQKILSFNSKAKTGRCPDFEAVAHENSRPNVGAAE